MKNRIIGFDLARAYAIFGMFVVNFNTVFGSHTNKNGLSGVLNLFNGNSSTLFVMLAGMGVSLMLASVGSEDSERKRVKQIIIRRSWFLFFIGVAFCLWWPADILHYYGGYMHIAVWFLFLPRKYFIVAAISAVIIFHGLFFLIPYETGWDFQNLLYTDFWTFKGFVRNTFYNGWNSIFPWIAYFFLGIYLGHLNWKNAQTARITLFIGAGVYIFIYILQTAAPLIIQNREILYFITSDYIPPFLPFLLSTASFGLMVISVFIWIGNRISETRIARVLVSTGQMTLTHYISHLVLGLFFLSLITNKTLGYHLIKETPTNPWIIACFSIIYFVFSCFFSYFWSKKFRHGPLETIMRKISD